MFMFRNLARLQTSRPFRFVVFALSACVFAAALHVAWIAFTAPLEIEVRESAVWLDVLAKRAGIDIYDTSQVAFVNMNHGPLDAIVKTWISRVLPFLPGHMVTRVFVLLTPVFLFAAAYRMSRRHLAAAMLAAGALFLIFLHMAWVTLVGRPDATAICGVVVCGVLTHRLLTSRHRNWSNRRYIFEQLGLGAASAAVFLTSWRFAPVFAALQMVVLSSQLANVDPFRRRSPRWYVRVLARLGIAAKNVVISSALYLAGFAVIWGAVFLIELHGDFRSYYRHFFGFFLGDGGWGTYPGGPFQILPAEVYRTRQPIVLLLAALVLWGLVRLRKHPGELIAWVVMLAANWLAVAYGYFKNQGGGGLYYFFEFFVLAWIFVLHAFGRQRRWGALAQLVLVVAVALTLPYKDLRAQRNLVAEIRTQGRIFREHVARITKGEMVFSEETHLYKSRYQGELTDAGDAAMVIARTGYFGAAFSRTYEKYTRELLANPPKFIMGGLIENEEKASRIMSSSLQALLRSRYKLRVMAKHIGPATGGSQALFERQY
jgi:hypothetical protein